MRKSLGKIFACQINFWYCQSRNLEFFSSAFGESDGLIFSRAIHLQMQQKIKAQLLQQIGFLISVFSPPREAAFTTSWNNDTTVECGVYRLLPKKVYSVSGAARVCPESERFFRSSAASGHYEYKSWSRNAKGERVAVKCSIRDARLSADLAANSYRNANGNETVFGLVFDFDAHRANDCWKDADGKLDWSKIFPALQKEIPEVAHLICYAVRSTGGLGLGVVMAITPLPIILSTAANQKSALKLQGRLLAVFDRMGLGADFGARGVSRDLPNFNNPAKLVYRNTAPLRELERSGRPVVTELHSLLNSRNRAARVAERIYNDERVEKGLAKLVLWLLGAAQFDKTWNFDGRACSRQFKKVPYLSGWTVSATMREICTLTGLSDAFLRKYFRNPPKWLKSAHYEGEGWNLSLPLSKDVPWLLERSMHLLRKTQTLKEKVVFDPNEISLPWWVQDGERNLWIVRLALTYKWAGYSLACAMEKVLLRVGAIPNAESSRNCKNVRSIVKSLYRRSPEHFGQDEVNELPEWIRSDKIFCSLFSRISHRRGITPVARKDSKPIVPVDGEICSSFSSHQQKSSTVFQTPRELSDSKQVRRIVVVRRKQRIGFFIQDKLVLCVTRKHYRASKVLEYLKKQIPDLRGDNVDVSLWSPRLVKQKTHYALVDSADLVVPSWMICGRRETLGETLDRCNDRRGVSNNQIEIRFSNSVDQDIPF
ncbi:MAG: hypothetical protein RL189_1495 [Pseudomonadota bacterium]